MHVDYVEAGQSANNETLKCKNCTLECTLEEITFAESTENVTERGKFWWN